MAAVLFFVAGCARPPCPVSPSDPAPSASVSMEPWDSLTGPSARHDVLKQLVGTFDAANTFWVYPGATPGAPPAQATARVENKLDLDGRFIVQDYRYPGRPFRGVTYYGFDNLTQNYQYVWLDSEITGIETMTGTIDATSRVITFRADEVDPISRKRMAVRMTLRIESDRRHRVERYETRQGKPEVKAEETVYTRVD
jgi:hypothetical protein